MFPFDASVAMPLLPLPTTPVVVPNTRFLTNRPVRSDASTRFEYEHGAETTRVRWVTFTSRRVNDVHDAEYGRVRMVRNVDRAGWMDTGLAPEAFDRMMALDETALKSKLVVAWRAWVLVAKRPTLTRRRRVSLILHA